MSVISQLRYELLHKFTTLHKLDDNVAINNIVEELITQALDTEFASLWIYNFPALTRIRESNIATISIQEKKGLLYECFAKKQEIIYNQLSSEKGYIKGIDNPDNITIKSKIMIPLIDNDKFIGIATAYTSTHKIKKFTNNDLDIFRAIAPFIIEALHKINKNTTSIFSKDDLNETAQNLNELEESFSNIKAPNEMLEYMSNIVHDIRTPANGLVGFLEILQEQIKDKRLKEYISHAKNSAHLINELTTSILDGVAEKRKPSIKEPKRVNTVNFFATVAEIFSANMSKKSINYNIFIDPLLPKEIQLNSMKTKRVIMNLISNASKFTPENGSIEFSVRYKQKEKKLHIFVKDSGIGIAQEKQEKIFEAFTQAEDETSKLYGGTGLGLTICAKYVQELGGKLSIESKLNNGSTFYFDIPMEIEEYAHQFKPIENNATDIMILMDQKNTYIANNIARYLVKIGVSVDTITMITQLEDISDNATHIIGFENKISGDFFLHVKRNNIKSLVVEENFLSLDANNLDNALLISQYSYFGETLYSFISEENIPKILLVEDDYISVVLLRSMLENEYCEIDVATNGEEGLEFLLHALKNSNPYRIVYTDHNMPLLSGSQMIQRYKKVEEDSLFKKTLTVSISGKDGIREESDYNYFATKPFKKKEIVSLFLQSIR